MQLTEKQSEGVKIALQRYNDGERYTIISGYAGTGKSTTVRAIVSALPVNENDVCYACFTGKACNVLLNKGNKNVSTLHKLLFKHVPTVSGKYIRTPVDAIPYKVVIVDEISMVSVDLINSLFSYDVYVIGLGDPFQLPPIKEKDNNHLLDYPHIFLDKIMRQAEESEIIKLSMNIREGKPLLPYKGTDVIVCNKNELTSDMLTWADQIITATNATRMSVNKTMRALAGYTESMPPQEGEKVICLTNYWENFSINENDPLVNGTIGYLVHPYTYSYSIPKYLRVGRTSIPGLMADIETELGDRYCGLFMDLQQYEKTEPLLDWKHKYPLFKNRKWSHTIPMDFTYGYAITCHKAQGSEWDKILVFEEAFPYADIEHRRWLYTAVTRAAKQVIVVRC